MQDLGIEEDQGVQRLLLGAGRDIAPFDQIGQEGADRLGPQGFERRPGMKGREPLNPANIGLFGAKGEVTQAHFGANPGENRFQLRVLGWSDRAFGSVPSFPGFRRK
jgi:hypothetical protein